MSAPKSLYLIDAHAYLHRAFHALPRLTNPSGEPIQAIYGFVRMMLKILRQYQPTYVVVCFDMADPTQRHEEFKEYKATRKAIDPELVSQFPKALEAVEAMGLALCKQSGLEADDLIAHLARAGAAKGLQVVIVSGDKDVLQLVNDSIRVLNEPKDILFDAAQVEARYGLPPERLPDMFALMGDSSDNVPGVLGIGEKTAVKLIQEHGDLEALLRAAPTIKGKAGLLLQQHAEQARLSRRLVELNRPCAVSCEWETFQRPDLTAERFRQFLRDNGFTALLKELAPPASAIQLAEQTERRFRLLNTLEEATAFFDGAVKSGRLVLDAETDRLDPLHARIIGLAMACCAGEGVYLPVTTVGEEQARQWWNHAIASAPDLRIGGHNLKYDWQCMQRNGFHLPRVDFDTMIAAYVLNPGRNAFGLKELALELLGQAMTPIETLIGRGAKQISMADVPVAEVAAYASADADMTMRLWDKLEKELAEQASDSPSLVDLYRQLEMPLITILGQMEQDGVLVDALYLAQLQRGLESRLKSLEAELHHLAGEVFNVNSPRQLGSILFEKLQLPAGRRTKTGYSTDEDTLSKLAGRHPLPAKLLEYRESQKLLSTYVVGLQQAIDTVDARVHTRFNQTGAATGRLSSTQPNLQNIPIRTELGREIRRAFLPAKGHVLVSGDYSQIDLRSLAHLSDDPVLRRAFQEGQDIHTTTACEIFGVTPDGVTKDLRRIAKSINFGIVYGLSAYGLSQQLGIPVEEAKAHIDRYFERYAGVKRWMDQTIRDAHQQGRVRTLLGRVRYLPDLQASNANVRGYAERAALNTPVQGTSADIIKAAMIRIEEARQKGQWTGRMLLQVHDELVFEIPSGDVERSARTVKALLEGAVTLSVPLLAEFKRGPNWNDMEPLHV